MSGRFVTLSVVVVACLLVTHTDVTIGSDDAGSLEPVLQALSQKVAQLEARVDVCDNELQELKKLQPTVIFSVHNHNYTFLAENHVNIPFDVTLFNTGGGYSTRHREFTAPVSGLYYISYRGWSKPNHAGFLHLTLNGNSISELPVGDTTHESASSQSLILHLTQGDFLSIYVATSGTILMMGDDRTTFMGYLIEAD